MDAIMYCVGWYSKPEDQNVKEKTTPAKIAKPPRVGMFDLWAFLSPGSSKRFLMIETLMIDGIAKKVMTKAVIQLKAMLIIGTRNSKTNIKR